MRSGIQVESMPAGSAATIATGQALEVGTGRLLNWLLLAAWLAVEPGPRSGSGPVIEGIPLKDIPAVREVLRASQDLDSVLGLVEDPVLQEPSYNFV